MVYSIPSQQRAFRLFAQRVDWLTRNFFQKVQIHEVFNLLWKARFDDYDVEKHWWRIPKTLENYPYSLFEEAISINEVRFQREMKTTSPIQFSRVDYLLANSDIEGGPTTKGKREFLRRFNYNLSNNTVWIHFKQLKEKKAVVPYVLFAGAGLEDFICISLYCDTQITKIIQILANFLPFSYVYLTDKGIALFFKRPIEWTGFVNRIIKETPKLPGVHDFMVVYQESQSGIRLGHEIYSRWNEKRQYWEFIDNDI